MAGNLTAKIAKRDAKGAKIFSLTFLCGCVCAIFAVKSFSEISQPVRVEAHFSEAVFCAC
ncbi:hypothetical protein BH18ACI2_BH18ACI2_09600 [soil metagenome]